MSVVLSGKEPPQRKARSSQPRSSGEGDVFSWMEAERLRLAGDLHRGLGQNLSALVFMMDDLLHRLKETAPDPELAETAREIHQSIQSSVVQCESLARLLLPGTLQGARLHEALSNLALIMSRRLGLACTFRCSPTFTTSDQAFALHVYRLVQDLIDYQAGFHGATAIDVRLQPKPGELTITLRPAGPARSPAPAEPGSRALDFIKLRVAHLRGTFSESARPQQIAVSLPRPASPTTPK